MTTVSRQLARSPAAPGIARRLVNAHTSMLVDELADDWGVLEGSTRVWFRLLAPRAGR